MSSAIHSLSRIAPRLLFGLGLLLLAIFSKSHWQLTLLVAVCLAGLRLKDGDWLTVYRIVSLLRWFFIPILLLHALFSPGSALLPGLPLFISSEGLMHGLWLCLRLLAMFVAASLMFRLLRRAEWIALITALPWAGRFLALRLMLLTSMKPAMQSALIQLRMQYCLRRSWRMFPQMLLAAFSLTQRESDHYARMLWLRWPADIGRVCSSNCSASSATDESLLVSSLYLLAGFLLCWLVVA